MKKTLLLTFVLFCFRYNTKGDPFKTLVHKAIYVFKEFEGLDIFIFGMMTQELYSRSNTNNKIYISTLDSVQLFQPQPKDLRGKLYREIITGYLALKKQHG